PGTFLPSLELPVSFRYGSAAPPAPAPDVPSALFLSDIRRTVSVPAGFPGKEASFSFLSLSGMLLPAPDPDKAAVPSPVPTGPAVSFVPRCRPPDFFPFPEGHGSPAPCFLRFLPVPVPAALSASPAAEPPVLFSEPLQPAPSEDRKRVV